MESTITLIFLVVIFKVVSTQDAATRGLYLKMMSPQCTHGLSVQIKPEQCCTIPNLFEDETILPCSPTDQKFKEPSIRGSPECAERTCWLRNNDLLFDNDELDKDAVRQYLDSWVAKRREYLPAVNTVKENCVGNKPMFGVDIMCEADKFIICLSFSFFNKCPNWLETENCASLRAYLEGCMPYYD